ncbi:MAG: hypothetical protein MRQ07_00430 [Candidatus Midichloria sp.]|nr:hypothetical protein [Candidatus Midichloria sp.]
MIGASVALLFGPIAPLAAVPLAILVSQTNFFKKNERLLKEKEQAIRNRFKTIVTKSIKSIETPSLEQSTAAQYPIRSLINAIEQYEGKDQKFLLKKSGEETPCR